MSGSDWALAAADHDEVQFDHSGAEEVAHRPLHPTRYVSVGTKRDSATMRAAASVRVAVTIRSLTAAVSSASLRPRHSRQRVRPEKRGAWYRLGPFG